ncbi:MAG: peptide chain release factor N(5)-glutamine methyltransferase [Paludibacteraceae bacterium]|nr:peptide chain release factor N(5)-glutamine methyltransferase [Paludibacteraceae bacterium]
MKELINHITAQLEVAYPKDEAQALAWWIVEEETSLSRSQLICGCKDTTFSPHMQEIVTRLLHFEPIQYIFGHTLWNGLDLKVTPATLIPRPETAELVEKVERLKVKGERLKVLDIGTGSGCIAIGLKKAHHEWQVTGIDISEEAIEVAKENAKRNGVEVEFKVADIFGIQNTEYRLQTDFEIVVSNPPYICESEKSSMRPNVLAYEPASALFVPDNDPLKFYRRIAELKMGKYLFFEINEAYPQELADMLKELGYEDIQITNDIYGKPRIIEARMA